MRSYFPQWSLIIPTIIIDACKWEEEAKTYLTAIELLIEAGRLDAVLFQFLYSFNYHAFLRHKKFLIIIPPSGVRIDSG